MPSKKKKYSARFPPARIKKIMQTDEEVGKVAAAVPVVISRALELFIESLILKTSQTTKARNAKTMSTQHIKQVILAEQKFDFLKELVNNIPDVQQSEESQDGSGGSSAAGRSTPDLDKPRKKRGRPKKGTESQDDSTGGPTRPKRGRPPKKKVQEPEAGSSEEDSATEENDTETGDEEEEDENDDEDDDHRNHDNHTGGSTGSGGNFASGGGPPGGRGDSSGSGITGSNAQPAGLPFAGYALPTVSPQIPAVVGNQPASLFAQVSEIPPVVSHVPPMGVTPVTDGSINSTGKPDVQKVEASNSASGTLSQTSSTSSASTAPTDNSAHTTSLSTSSNTETVHNTVTTPSTAFAATRTVMATNASHPTPTTSVISSTCAANSNDPHSNIANNVRKSPVTVPNSHVSPNSVSNASASVSDSVVSKTPATGASTEEATSTTTALPSATTIATTDKSQQDKTSALKEDEDSNHSSDSEGRVAAQVGSHAMNMIMSGYDPQKGQSVTASAAMNMIKDQYNNKLVDLKLASSSLIPAASVIKSEIKPENSPVNFTKMESTVNHAAVNMIKHELQSTKGLLSSPAGPLTSESVPSFVKKDELDLKHVNMLEGGVPKPAHGPPPLIPTKKEEPQKEKESARREEPMDMNTTDTKSPEIPVQNHASPSPQPSPKPGSPSALVANERPSSSSQPVSTPNSLAVGSPVVEKSPLTQMAGAPFGLLGAYRPFMPGVQGVQLARMPVMSQPSMYAAPAGVLAHPSLGSLGAAGYGGIPFTGASALQAAAMPHMASPLAMAGGVRYAAAPHAAAYMPAAMMPTVPAATGPYSHLGVPGPDPYLAALGMGMGVPTAATAQYANPAAATAMYPQFQMAQAQAAPQFAMISPPRVPFQGFLPRPPT